MLFEIVRPAQLSSKIDRIIFDGLKFKLSQKDHLESRLTHTNPSSRDLDHWSNLHLIISKLLSSVFFLLPFFLAFFF